jgi:hypothetical protein
VEIFAKIAERRIREAQEEGAFDGLPGAGRPLVFEDEAWVPEDLRLAYRVLKNAGCVPPELEIRQEIINLRGLMETIDDDRERLRRLRELNFKLLSFNMKRKRPLSIEDFPVYEDKLFGRATDPPSIKAFNF